MKEKCKNGKNHLKNGDQHSFASQNKINKQEEQVRTLIEEMKCKFDLKKKSLNDKRKCQ